MSFNLESLPEQKGRTAIVTGANTGLGFQTTIELARKGMTVIMACRNNEKAEAAKSAIETRLDDPDLEIMLLDLASLAAVHSFADQFRQTHHKLDLLINNAGVMVPPKSTTEDGFELQFGVNYLGHFLLTALLIDMMPDRPESRVVTLSSIAHKSGEIHFDDLQWEDSYDRQAAYGQSKLACLMFADELDRRLRADGKQKRSVAAHPGVSPTDLSRHMPSLLLTLFKPLMPLFTHAPKSAARPTLMAALAGKVDGGDYVGPQGWREMKGEPGPAERAEQALDQPTAKRLWEVSEELTNQTFSLK